MIANLRLALARVGLLTLLVCLGFPGLAWSQGPWPPVLGGFRPLTTLRGEVICVGCGLAEARRTYPNAVNLYEMRYPGGKLVMSIDWVNHESREYLEDVAGLTDTLRLRGSQQMLEELTDETTRSKEVKMTGVLRSTRTFDILNVEVLAG